MSAPQPYAPVPELPHVKPSWAWYVLGVGIAVAAIVAAIVLFIVRLVEIGDEVDDFPRMLAPGRAEVVLPEARGYTIFYESKSEIDGREVEASDDVPFILLDVTAPDGSAVPVRSYDGDFSFSFSGKTGEAVFTMRAPVAGTYIVEARVAGGRDEPFVLAFGTGVVRQVLRAGIWSAVIAFAGIAVMVPIVVTTGMKRGRAKRARRRAELAAAPPPFPAGPGASRPAPGSPLPPPPPPGAPSR